MVLNAITVKPLSFAKACNTCNFLLAWGSAGSGNSQFSAPQSIAVDSSGNVYVADSNNNRIEKFSSTGNYISQWGTHGSGPGQFSNPMGVTVDSSGNVYVTDPGNDRVEKFTDNGAYITQWNTMGTVMTSNGPVPGRFTDPLGVAVDSSGNVYVTDGGGNYGSNRVVEFNGTGSFINQCGCGGALCVIGSGSDTFIVTQGIAVDASGHVYFVNSYGDDILVVNGSGALVDYMTGRADLVQPEGIGVDSAGNVYVTVSNNTIQKFSSSGNYLTSWGSTGSGNGQFNNPNAVAVDSSGNVYVLDSGNSRVEKFGDLPPITDSMTVSYLIVGGGNPAPPVFHYVLAGVSESLTLTQVAKSVSVDAGTTWYVTPNPLIGSSSSQQWYSMQPLNGTASTTNIQFLFQHQYYLTMNVSSTGGGTVTPNSGWYGADEGVMITAKANPGYKFKSWTGTGSGSFTGTSTSHTISMKSAITETANFT